MHVALHPNLFSSISLVCLATDPKALSEVPHDLTLACHSGSLNLLLDKDMPQRFVLSPRFFFPPSRFITNNKKAPHRAKTLTAWTQQPRHQHKINQMKLSLRTRAQQLSLSLAEAEDVSSNHKTQTAPPPKKNWNQKSISHSRAWGDF